MTATNTAANTQSRSLPRSYMPEEDKIGLSQNAIYACESSEAAAAGDEEASWAWLALAELPEISKGNLWKLDFAIKNFTATKTDFS